MPIPSDIDQRIQRAKANGFTDAQIQADIRRKYGADYSPTQKPSQPTPKASLLERAVRGAGRFLGNEKFGEGLGVAAFQLTGDKRNLDRSLAGLSGLTQRAIQRAQALPQGDPRRAELLRLARSNQQLTSGVQKDQATQGPTNREFLSGAANTAINVLGAGTIAGRAPAGAALRSGRMAVSVAAQPLKAAALQSATQSGALAASNTLGRGGTGKEAARNAALAAGTAGLLTGAVGLAGKAIGKLTKGGAEGIYRTSARLEHDDDAGLLIREGLTGGRKKLEKDVARKLAESQALKMSAPEIKAGLPDEEILSSEPVKRIAAEAKLLGRGRAVEDELRRLLPEGFGDHTPSLTRTLAKAEPSPILDDLAAKASREIGATPADEAAFTKAFERYVADTNRLPSQQLGGKLALKEALDKNTPQGIFRNTTAGQLRGRVGNAVANAIRGRARQISPTVARELDREQAFIALQSALERMGRSKATLPGSAPSLIQRTLLTPALGTKTARGLYLSGAPARFLDQHVVTDALRRAIRAGTVAGANSAVAR